MYLAVCDDHKNELSAVSSLPDERQEKRQAALRRKEFQSAGELPETARRERFTLCLLDAITPGLDGLGCAREIRRFGGAAKLALLPVSSSFAYENCGLRALNCLLKPVSRRSCPQLRRDYMALPFEQRGMIGS